MQRRLRGTSRTEDASTALWHFTKKVIELHSR